MSRCEGDSRELHLCASLAVSTCRAWARAWARARPCARHEFVHGSLRHPAPSILAATPSARRSTEFSQGCALGWQRERHLVGVHIDRRNQHETGLRLLDLPVIIVAEQMMMLAEQDSINDYSLI